MAKRSVPKPKPVPVKRTKSSKSNIWMALTLVPLLVGGLLIVTWALDIFTWEDSQSQVFVGLFFALLSFVATNALQKHWYAAAGWALLAVSDLLLLIWIDLQIQIFAFLVGGLGIVLLLYEFIRRFQKEVQRNPK